MPRVKRDVAELKKRAINSIVLGIELFNRPHDQGRCEGVLIFMHHAFEMLLKAIIMEKTRIVHTKEGKKSYRFDKCLEVARAKDVRLLTDDERYTLSCLDASRNNAMHYYQEISEDLLYIMAQESVTLFNDFLKRAFDESLGDLLPERVLPISTHPPKDIQVLIDSEFSQIDSFLKPGSRKGLQATARLRSIIALATASRDEAERLTEVDIRKAVARRRKGEEWKIIFPEIAQLKLDSEGEGIPIYFRIKRDAEMGVRIAKEGEPVNGTLIKHTIKWSDKYSLSISDLASKVKLTIPKTRAYLFELNVWSDPEMYGEEKWKSQTRRCYTMKALNDLHNIIEQIPIEKIWEKHGRKAIGKE